MNDDAQSTTDTNSDAEPTLSETSTATAETPVQQPENKKAGRGARSEKAAKASKPAKSARTPKDRKSEETAAPDREEAAETVAKSATKGKLVSTAKTAKPAKPTKSAEAAKAAKSAGAANRAKPKKAAEAAKTAKPTKVAKFATKAAKAAQTTASKNPTTVAVGGRDKGARYTTNELSSATKKAGLAVQFTPVVTKPANIGRGPAKEFKVDAIVARLRGSNGDLISERGPGTPLYNDAESLAAVEIFKKFRGRTFHKKLKVEIL